MGENGIALIRFTENIVTQSELFIKMLEGDDIILSGEDKGKSRFYRQIKKNFFPAPIKDSKLGLENISSKVKNLVISKSVNIEGICLSIFWEE